MKQKKILVSLTLVLVLIILLPVRVLAAQFMKTTTDLRMRQGVGTTTAILDTIPKGTQIEILDTVDDWAKTTYNGKIGYSSLRYLMPDGTTTMTMVTIDLRLRQGPSTNYAILASIPKNTPVPILGKSGKWIKTSWSGKVGWVGSTYTKLLTDLPNLETSIDLNLRTGAGTAYSIIEQLPKGTRLPVMAISSSGNWAKTWANGKIGWLSRKYLVNPSLSFRPASPPSFILDYSNRKLSWSHTFPQDSAYAYPQLGGCYRYADDNIHLTFDLGYENGLTPGFLDTLLTKNVKAKFYVTGYYLRTEPELIKRMLAEGHIIGNHSDKHPDTPDLMASSLQKVYDDLLLWEAEYKKITGGYPTKWYYRPPSGVFSERVIGLAYWMDYATELYEVALADWDPDNQLTPEDTLKRLLKDTKRGSIVLLHTVSSTNQQILGEYIDEIRAKGWEFGDPWLD